MHIYTYMYVYIYIYICIYVFWHSLPTSKKNTCVWTTHVKITENTQVFGPSMSPPDFDLITYEKKGKLMLKTRICHMPYTVTHQCVHKYIRRKNTFGNPMIPF